MSNSLIQEILITAIGQLKMQYRLSGVPCLALFISRQYQHLKDTTEDEANQENYAVHAKAWLSSYINHPDHPKQLQRHLSKLELHDETHAPIQ